ncbi:MAG: ROK family transcriptional regulator [Lachnospiraceae bacterium]|nr:ROK family transcriptional regulator [Lachnospiraceae bacterium]
MEIKKKNRIKIAKFILEQGTASKNEIAAALKISMPTVLQNVKELQDAGIVIEEGEYHSNGGRKAKALSIEGSTGYAVGMDITANHITLVLVNMKRRLLCKERSRLTYADEPSYYEKMGAMLENFIFRSQVDREKILGVGISLPGIVNKEEKVLIRSHALGVGNISFHNFHNLIPYPYEIENDANCAAYAELTGKKENAVYLSLSNTVGGAIYLNNHFYLGEHFRSGEFGHMVIERGGRQCYCGKRGCVDAYCSARLLQGMTGDNLELFFQRVNEKDEKCLGVWEEYLDYLAVTVTNLRMNFDCDIVLGGYVGGYLKNYRTDLERKVAEYNKFDLDAAYIRTGKYRLEASAIGATMQFIDHFFDLL